MSPGRPDAERIDFLIDGDRIAETSERLDRPETEAIDLSGRILIPGLVNARDARRAGVVSGSSDREPVLRLGGADVRTVCV